MTRFLLFKVNGQGSIELFIVPRIASWTNAL